MGDFFGQCVREQRQGLVFGGLLAGVEEDVAHDAHGAALDERPPGAAGERHFGGQGHCVLAGAAGVIVADRGDIAARKNGSLVSMEDGEAMSYALNMVQERGRLMVDPGDKIYKGMIVGENARENDIPVNPCKAKKLSNMRSTGDGKGIQLDAPFKMSLERALEYIGPDEYVEATPKNLRLRKKILDEVQRKRSEQSRVNRVVAE